MVMPVTIKTPSAPNSSTRRRKERRIRLCMVGSHGLIQEIQQERAAQPLPQGRQPRLAEDRVPHVALAGEIHQRFGDIHAFKLHHFRAEPRRQLQVVLKLALDARVYAGRAFLRPADINHVTRRSELVRHTHATADKRFGIGGP